MILYRTTTKEDAEAVLRDGFRDRTRKYMFRDTELTGVWLADTPMTINEGARGDHVFRVEFPDDVDLPEPFVDPEHDYYREWNMPADFINTHATVRLMTDDELEEMGVPIWRGMDDPPPGPATPTRGETLGRGGARGTGRPREGEASDTAPGREVPLPELGEAGAT